MSSRIFIRLPREDLVLLGRMADEELRDPADQAALLVRQGLLRWQANQDVAALLETACDVVTQEGAA